MNQDHKKLLVALKKAPTQSKKPHFSGQYTGSTTKTYGVATPVLRSLVTSWLKDNREYSPKEVLQIIDSLMQGASHEEKKMGSFLLGYLPEARSMVSAKQLHSWLERLVGWAEVDALCQNNFSADEILRRWDFWKPLLDSLAQSSVASKQRASLVFLVGPTRVSADERLHSTAFENINTLKGQTDILITKATSWLLRSMASTQPEKVNQYIIHHESHLPRIAVRETMQLLQKQTTL